MSNNTDELERLHRFAKVEDIGLSAKIGLQAFADFVVYTTNDSDGRKLLSEMLEHLEKIDKYVESKVKSHGLELADKIKEAKINARLREVVENGRSEDTT